MGSVDLRLQGPLRRIAELAVERADWCGDSELDLFDLREVLRRQKADVCSFMREAVEQLTNNKETLRPTSSRMLKYPMGGTATQFLVVCPYDTPEGEIALAAAEMFVFALAGASNSYTPQQFK